MLWLLQGLNEDNKDIFCDHRAYDTNMIGWLHGVDREQPGSCAGYSG